MLKVDLGCGPNKPAGFIGVDIVPGQGIDIVHDLSLGLPFADDSVDVLRAHDAIEHWPDRIKTMNEIYRVCKNGAIVDLRVPSTDGRGAFQDPSHLSYWNANSFNYYSPSRDKVAFEYGKRYGFQGCFAIKRLKNKKSSNQVVHVEALLQVVKPAP